MSARPLALIVDDKYLDRLSAFEMTEEVGLTPIEAGNPGEAADLLKAHTDIVMVIVGAGIVQSPAGREFVSLLEGQNDLVVLVSRSH